MTRALWRRLVGGSILFVLTLAAWPAMAHKASDAYLTIRAGAGSSDYAGQWDIALRDIDAALAIDENGDRQLSWGEIRTARSRIEQYAYPLLHVATTTDCTVKADDLLIDRHSDGHYAVLVFTLHCPEAADAVQIRYGLMQGVDASHRGLLQWVSRDGGVQSLVLIPGQPQSLSQERPSPWRQFGQYVHEGVHHIWIGYDHLLFLISLLLPAVLLRRGDDWAPAMSARAVAWKVAGIVTAFTLAHSITLTLAALDLVRLPSRLVESVIALSVILAALNNVRPWITERAWAFAFGFGLLHGFGFAGALADLGLPRDALALCLLAFNVGVELGQLSVVAMLLPMAFALRRSVFYRRVVLVPGSLLIAALALIWLTERVLDLRILPGGG